MSNFRRQHEHNFLIAHNSEALRIFAVLRAIRHSLQETSRNIQHYICTYKFDSEDRGGNEGNERKLEGYLHVLFRYLIEIFIVTTQQFSLRQSSRVISYLCGDFKLRCCFSRIFFFFVNSGHELYLYSAQ